MTLRENILIALSEKDQTSYELSDWLKVKTKSVCGSLSQLARRGLVTSEYIPTGTSQFTVIQKLTDAGRDEVEKLLSKETE